MAKYAGLASQDGSVNRLSCPVGVVGAAGAQTRNGAATAHVIARSAAKRRTAPATAAGCQADRASTVTSDRPKPATSSWPISPASGSSTLAASSAGCQAASRSFIWACRCLRPLEDRRDALPAADAHRRERVSAAGPLELEQRLDGQDGTGSADRMAEGDAAAVGVRLVRWQPELADDGQRLRGEGLIDLEHIDFLDLEPGAVEHLLYGR